MGGDRNKNGFGDISMGYAIIVSFLHSKGNYCSIFRHFSSSILGSIGLGKKSPAPALIA